MQLKVLAICLIALISAAQAQQPLSPLEVAQIVNGIFIKLANSDKLDVINTCMTNSESLGAMINDAVCSFMNTNDPFSIV